MCLIVFVYRNIAHTLIHSSYWFYDHFFSWNHGNQMWFLCETQKYGEKLNKTWMITFNIGILATFGNFWANICLVQSTCSLSSYISAWNHGGQIFSFRVTKKTASFEIWWIFLPKIKKNSQIWGKFGISRQILDKLSAQWLMILISTKRPFNWVSDVFLFHEKIYPSFWVMLF